MLSSAQSEGTWRRSRHGGGGGCRERGDTHKLKKKKQPLKCHCLWRGSISSELRQSVLHRYPLTLGTALHSHHTSHTQGQDSHMKVVKWGRRAQDQEARVLRAGPGFTRSLCPSSAWSYHL